MPKPTEAPKAEAPAATGATADQAAALPVITAGIVDDNDKWADYLDYRTRHVGLVPAQNDRDVSQRYIITLRDKRERPIPDAETKVFANNELVFTARSDAGGRVRFHPNAQPLGPVSEFKVVATKGDAHAEATFAVKSGKDAGSAGATSIDWPITLNGAAIAEKTQLDLVFLVDVTGSMNDELSKLQTTMGEIANQISKLPQRPDIRYGLVAYGDRGDSFVVRGYDFTSNLTDFQSNLSSMPVVNGHDEPESLNAGLHYVLNQMTWRDQDTVRMLILVADAPPHLDYADENFSYDRDMFAAVQKGIKIVSIGASGLSAQGEYIFRQLAQFTGGKFVFLTYAEPGNAASGPGSKTDHDVSNYSVDTLDRLIVRVVREELDKLPKP